MGPEPRGTRECYEAALRLLEEGPLTPLGLERAMERAWPLFLRGRRGYVHPLLLHLWRRGAVAPCVVETPRGPRRGYVLADRPSSGAPAAETTPDAPALPRPLERATRKMVRGLDFAPGLREHVRLDVAAHLADSVAARRDAGESERDAIGDVLSEFGDAWRIRTDLRRVAQGRRAVLFPRTLRETLTGLAIYDAGILLCIVAGIVFVRLQVFSAYHIPTRSMEPTLHGDKRDGDRILVNRLAPPPSRFDIYVFDGWGAERKNYVKRCVGLPGETLRLREGDVYVDGELVRKRGATYEALMFPLYAWDDVWDRARREHPDDPEAAHDEVFDAQFELWENVAGRWTLDTRRGYRADAPADGERAILRWRDTVHDDLYDPATGEVERGIYTCPDVRITADVTLEEDGSEVVLRLSRGASVYSLVLAAGHAGLLRKEEGEEATVASLDDVPVRVGEPVRVRFAQVDRVLRLQVGDVEAEHDLPAPDYPKRSAPHAQIDICVRSGPAQVKPVALERDVFYTPEYDEDVVELGPDDYFMLGDNSGNSQDSRRNGAVHRSRLVGRPILIVWPPSRWRIPR